MKARTCRVGELSAGQITSMRHLMESCYENVRPDVFEGDLLEKDWVILLEREGLIFGFSTLLFFEHMTPAGPVRVVFSGDTVIERKSWGTAALPMAWARLVIPFAADASQAPLYWLLICKGYKTYRYLPVFVKTFYPRYDDPAPSFESALMIDLARMRFGDRFDPDKGVIRSGPGHDYLKAGIAEITPRRRTDPHVAFFEECNPGHAAGDELVCLARLSIENLKTHILRALR